MWVLYFMCTFVIAKIRSYGNYAIFFNYQRPPYNKEVWEPIHYSVSNTFDPFAVSIMNDGEIVGHMP